RLPERLRRAGLEDDHPVHRGMPARHPPRGRPDDRGHSDEGATARGEGGPAGPGARAGLRHDGGQPDRARASGGRRRRGRDPPLPRRRPHHQSRQRRQPAERGLAGRPRRGPHRGAVRQRRREQPQPQREPQPGPILRRDPCERRGVPGAGRRGGPGSDSAARGALMAGRRPGRAAVGAGWAVFVIANTQRIDVVPFFNDLRPYYHTDYAGVGALLSAYLLGYLLAQVPMGLAADNLPTRRVTLAGLALIAATSGVFALVRQYWPAMLLRFLMGASGAALYSSTVKLLLGIAPSRGAAMGVLQSGAGTGMIVGLFALPLLAQVVGIRSAFLAVAAASVVTLGYGAACLPGGTVSRAAGGTIGRQVGTIVRDRYFAYLASCTFLGLFSAYGITAWLPTYLRNEFRFTSAAAGAIASLINVGLAAAAPVTGALSDRLGLRGPVIAGGFGALALAFALLLGVHSA